MRALFLISVRMELLLFSFVCKELTVVFIDGILFVLILRWHSKIKFILQSLCFKFAIFLH